MIDVVKIKNGEACVSCDACKRMHYIAIEKPSSNGSKWSFNGDLVKPTFNPSVLVKSGRAADPNYVPKENEPPEICHFFVRDGNIEYCSDCSHALAGKTIALKPIGKHFT